MIEAAPVQPVRRAKLAVSAFAVVFGAAALLLPLVGPFPLSPSRVVARLEPDWSILINLRLSRTLLGLFAGGALSLAGAVFQSMLQNALATPYTLGVSAGASLGATLAIWFGWHAVAGVPAIWVTAMAGAVTLAILVGGAAVRGGQLVSVNLLLTGLAANSICSASIVIVYGLAGPAMSFSITRWLVGSVDSTDVPSLIAFLLAIGAASALVIGQARGWNLISVDPEWAAARGTNVPRLMAFGYASASWLTGVTVALIGPIGFIGLIVPNLVRQRVATDHRVLLPCAFLGGGVLLASCDAIGRVIVAPAEIPAGAIMAILGGPYLVWIMRRRR